MKLALFRTALGLSILLSGLLSSSARAAADLRTDTLYRIVSRASGLVVDVSGVSTADGAQVWLWQWLDKPNQHWSLAPAANGAYTIVSENSGKVIDVSAGSKDNGGAVIQWTGWGGANQQWNLKDLGGGVFQLVNVNSGKCLDAFLGSTSNGTGLQQWDCGDADNQKWTIEALSGSTGTGGGTGSTGSTGSNGSGNGGQATGGPAGIHASGNSLYDENGNAVRLHGVNISSLDWGNGEPTQYGSPAPCWSGQSILDSVKKAIGDWKVNFIRLPITPDRWWNAVDGQGPQYRATIDSIVDYATSQGVYVDVDMHNSDMGVWGSNVQQHFMPDDHTQVVLQDIATHFAGNLRVIIGIYNEPHDVDWGTWRNGGTVNENGTSYHTPGIQALVNTVRATGAKNLVTVSGLDWSFDLRGVMNGYAINDDNLMYESHIYTFKGFTDNWDNNITVARSTYPVLIGEFGADYQNLSPYSNPADFLTSIHSWLDQHQYNYSAWNMHPTSWPPLIKDWCYNPTDPFGTMVIPWL